MQSKITASFLKKVLLLTSFISFAQLVHTYSGGAPSGYTGAPGEGSCTSCHSATAITSGPTWSNLTLTRTGGLNTILPNSVNTLTLNLASGTSTDFGFQLCVLPNTASSTSASIGTFSAGSNFDIQTTSASSPNRMYLTQTTSGISASGGSKSYTFNWQTPSTFNGSATFYLAFNEANGNSSSSGDNIYLKTFSVTVLPVRWLDFSATEEGNNLVLRFSTAQEINNQKFEIEQSTDGKNFVTMGSLKGKGNSEQISRYVYTIAGIPTQIMHYRIKQIDFDGQSDYSKIISFNPAVKSPTEVFVSNVNNSLLFSQINTIKEVSVYSLNGALQASFKQIEQAQLSLPSVLPAGVYLLRVSEKDGRIWHKKIGIQN
jgi:hypothetical protein